MQTRIKNAEEAAGLPTLIPQGEIRFAVAYRAPSQDDAAMRDQRDMRSAALERVNKRAKGKGADLVEKARVNARKIVGRDSL